jgi:hypothetical protein
MLAPAPHLTGNNRCSDCGIHAMPAGSGEIKVCPQCYACLWRRDYREEERQHRTVLAAQAAERARNDKARRDAAISERIRMRAAAAAANEGD